MAKEIQCVHSTSGATLYAQILNSVGQAWNFNGLPNAFEAYQTANYGDYVLALDEFGTASKIWAGDMPPTIPIGVYSIVVRVQAGGAPAESDTFVTAGQIYWNGTTVVYLGTPQTGDNYARIGTPAGASIAADIAAIPTGVWAVGTRTLTSFGTLVVDVAAAVWAYATRTLSALATIVWTSPLNPTGSVIETVQGNSYFEEDGDIASWTFAADPDLTGSVVVERVRVRTFDNAFETLTFTCEVTGAGTASQVVKLEHSAADTLSIPVGEWDGDIYTAATAAGNPKILKRLKHKSKRSTLSV